MQHWWNYNWYGKAGVVQKTLSLCPFFGKSHWTALKSNLGSCGDKLANIHQSYRRHLFSGKFT